MKAKLVKESLNEMFDDEFQKFDAWIFVVCEFIHHKYGFEIEEVNQLLYNEREVMDWFREGVSPEEAASMATSYIDVLKSYIKPRDYSRLSRSQFDKEMNKALDSKDDFTLKRMRRYIPESKRIK
jgi:hypothetical protein